MKNLGKALLVGASMLWATAAVAGDQDFTLTNKTGYQIDSIYVSPSNSTNWDEDVMGRDALANGEGVDITFANNENTCKWDIKAVYNDGEEAVWEGFNLCEVSKITLHYNNSTGVTSATYE